MHSDAAPMSITIHKRILSPASFIGAHAAASNHFPHSASIRFLSRRLAQGKNLISKPNLSKSEHKRQHVGSIPIPWHSGKQKKCARRVFRNVALASPLTDIKCADSDSQTSTLSSSHQTIRPLSNYFPSVATDLQGRLLFIFF